MLLSGIACTVLIRYNRVSGLLKRLFLIYLCSVSRGDFFKVVENEINPLNNKYLIIDSRRSLAMISMPMSMSSVVKEKKRCHP
ncbi:unnamed protein product [Callosobruchus maculatus]|uniref:Uncharacterized protein n=1 Tax=Callosobruchus maculatus TaxID=64391 RepID=A0A653DS17_CALMS|nr:unnamed protein product [Callosobruchus maculatus]